MGLVLVRLCPFRLAVVPDRRFCPSGRQQICIRTLRQNLAEQAAGAIRVGGRQALEALGALARAAILEDDGGKVGVRSIGLPPPMA